MVALACGAAWAAGCGRIAFDQVPPELRGDGGGGGGDGGDGNSPDASSCTMPSVADDFSVAGNPCGTWGSPFNVSASDRTNGQLRFTAPTGAPTNANCNADTFDFSNGSFAEVSQVVSETSGFVQLDAFTIATTPHNVGVEYYADNNTLQMYDATLGRFGAVSFNAVAMRWWRLRPSAAHEITGEYSADGRTWTVLGSSNVGTDSIATLKIVFGAGHYATEATTSTAIFDSWNVCP